MDSRLRTQDEIQLAYNSLQNVLKFHSDKFEEQDDVINIAIMRDSLSWVLKINDDKLFEQNLKAVLRFIYGEGN